MPSDYVVTTDYEAAYAEPLSGSKGDALTLERADTEWPGWVWCSLAGSQSGWVPKAWIEDRGDGTGVLNRDYTARELTVAAGDAVVAPIIESGWAWGTNAAGESGWVPLRHLVRM